MCNYCVSALISLLHNDQIKMHQSCINFFSTPTKSPMPDFTSLPIYQQVSERLARDVLAGRLRAGTKLAPERDMAAGLGIAVGTLRKALDQLAEQGMLERIHGSGNYIKTPAQASNIYAFFRLELTGGGGLPRAEILDVRRMTKPADLPVFGTSTQAHRIRRFRTLDDTPAALEEIWLDGDVVDTLSAEAMSESLYLYYRTRLDLVITRFEDRVAARQKPDWGHERLDLPAHSGFAERFSWVDDDIAIEYSRTWFHPDRVVYVARA